MEHHRHADELDDRGQIAFTRQFVLIGHDEFVVLSEQAPAVESHRTPLRDARRANRLRTRIEHGDVVVGKDRIVERRRQNDVDQRFALQFFFFVARNVGLSEAFDGLLEEGLIGNISVGKDHIPTDVDFRLLEIDDRVLGGIGAQFDDVSR